MSEKTRGIWMSDEEWSAVKRAAREQSVRDDRTVSAAEWVREAIRMRLEAEG